MPSDGRELRKAFMDDFRPLHGRNTVPGAACIVGLNVALAVLAAFLSLQSFQYAGHLAVPVYILCVFFIGTRYRALANIIHECAHYSFTQARAWNNIFGKLLSIPLFSSFEDYRKSHYSHHQHLGDDERDLDFKDLKRFRFGEMITRAMFLRHFLTTITLRHLPLYIGRMVFVKTDAALYNLLRISYIAAIASIPLIFGLLSTETLLLVAYGIVPYAVTLQIITYWQDALDHAGVIKNADELYQTRNSVLNNRVLRQILFPRNDCYHLVHHLFPHIPVADLPASHAVLMRDPRYAGLDHDIVRRAKALWWTRA